MTDHRDEMEANRRRWDEAVAHHVAAPLYGVAEFLAGAGKLSPAELAEVGPVAGRTLLHLQCHFGLDTLSWAREGAVVTGVDFAPAAIAQAKALAARANLPARFVESDVYGLPDRLHETFDVVYTSRGAICWMPDIRRWAAVVARFVRPGGFFYMEDTHPLAACLAPRETPDGPVLAPRFDYFGGAPVRMEQDSTYADPGIRLTNTVDYTWDHPVGAVVTALAEAGLRIEFLHERDAAYWDIYPGLTVETAPGTWRLPPTMPRVPLVFSVRAAKPL